jgi:hypothetical protein
LLILPTDLLPCRLAICPTSIGYLIGTKIVGIAGKCQTVASSGIYQ